MRFRKAPPLLAALALLFAGALHAQSATLRGRVMDGGTGEPIASASIRVSGCGGSVTGRSDQAGLFSIPLPAAGTYTVKAQRLGYSEFISPPVDVAAGATVEVQVRMTTATVALDSVDVSVRHVPEFRDPRAGQFYARMEAGRGVYLRRSRSPSGATPGPWTCFATCAASEWKGSTRGSSCRPREAIAFPPTTSTATAGG
jgi:hypothetical protein